MYGARFDALAKALTARLSGRAAVGDGAHAAAGVDAAGPIQRPGAQDATPAEPGLGGEFLFVQTFAGGTLAPKPGEDGAFLLTLTGGADQTVYFSDRPERIVGAMPTARFLGALGFPPDNPPNAALVAQTNRGEDILVVELRNPIYTQTFGAIGGSAATLTYDVRILADYAKDGLAHLAERRVDADVAETFGRASLFIDDCPDIVHCYDSQFRTVGEIPGAPIGTCWKWSSVECVPCDGTHLDDLNARCNTTYPEACHRECYVYTA